MKKRLALVAAGLVALVAVSGFAAATSTGIAPLDASESDTGYGPGDGVAADDDRPLNGTNSPWVTGDDRLDVIQDRFDLTDQQMAEIQQEVRTLVEEDATQDEIRSTVTEMLESYGVEDPELGPPADRGPGSRGGPGPGGMGPADGTRGGYGAGNGPGTGSGPHGPADGTCLG